MKYTTSREARDCAKVETIITHRIHKVVQTFYHNCKDEKIVCYTLVLK